MKRVCAKVLIAIFSGFMIAEPSGINANEVQGIQVFTTHCIVCHGEKGNGKGPAAASLKPKPRNFKKGLKSFKYGTTLADVVKTISNGSPGTAMPPFKSVLNPEQLEAVAAYVRSLAGAKD